MIQYVMLVALGFFLACFMFVLVAPTFWNRAVRLTRRRMEATMPLTLSEIEADKDQLRASFAVKIRRLESALGKAKEKSAHQLVEITRSQMAVGELRDQIAALERALDERRNAASVFELTIKKRFPELEEALRAAKADASQSAYEISDLNNKLKRREEDLGAVKRSSALQQAEITRLRDAMEKSGAEKSARFKKRPSQWSLDEYRAEYDRLNVELSKLREQLSTAYDRESHQIAFLKAELQQLAQQIIVAAKPVLSPAEKIENAPPASGLPPKPAEGFIPRLPPRRPASPSPFTRPEPWIKDQSDVAKDAARPEVKAAAAEIIDPAPLKRPTPLQARPQPRDARDDFSNKSLEEVLEAALPVSAEAVVVRVDKADDVKPRASTLVAPILKPASIEADKPAPAPAPAPPTPAVTVIEEASIRPKSEDAKPAPEAATDVKPPEAAEPNAALEDQSAAPALAGKTEPEDSPALEQKSPRQVDPEPAPRRTLLDRLRGVDERAG
jgi:predicted  nucleic acid-binding Zn-ribbon protein